MWSLVILNTKLQNVHNENLPSCIPTSVANEYKLSITHFVSNKLESANSNISIFNLDCKSAHIGNIRPRWLAITLICITSTISFLMFEVQLSLPVAKKPSTQQTWWLHMRDVAPRDLPTHVGRLGLLPQVANRQPTATVLVHAAPAAPRANGNIVRLRVEDYRKIIDYIGVPENFAALHGTGRQTKIGNKYQTKKTVFHQMLVAL